eukprot:TRINITY_DN3339_c0_g2_i1.p1 TRINITY_DN3339_c0_g2~~TRINITY_DN3339_c0_g2_i1.p1  ORF type:complete len:315 (-),score=45.67 TRINITY_DN3339_c0_g2_i1:106-1050(-)
MPSYKSSAPAKHLKFTQLCKFFAEGQCDRGALCTYAHTTDEVRSQPDFTKTRLCKGFMKFGRCDEGAACKFAHGREEMQNRKAALANVASSTSAGHKQGEAALNGARTPHVPVSMAAEAQGVLAPGAAAMSLSRVPDQTLEEMALAAKLLVSCVSMHQQPLAPGAAAMSLSRVPDQTLEGMALAAKLLVRCVSMHQEPSNDRDSVWRRGSNVNVDDRCPPFVHMPSSGSVFSDADSLSFAGAICSRVDTSPSSRSSSSSEVSQWDMRPPTKTFFQGAEGFWRQHGIILKNTFIDRPTQMDVQKLRRCSSAPLMR